MSKIKKTIMIDEQLWLAVKDELNISLGEFVEQSLRLFTGEDTEMSSLMKKGTKLQSELNQIQGRMYKLMNKNKENRHNQELFDNAMDTIQRIHDKLGYIGKNQLRKIANQNEINADDLIRYCQKKPEIIIKNYGALPK
jgi:succinate dehydrogenase/fumarate reductase flavoprotein subunit